jgi:hypothetical protein
MSERKANVCCHVSWRFPADWGGAACPRGVRDALKPNAALAGLLGLRAHRQQPRRQNPNDGLTTDSSMSVKA